MIRSPRRSRFSPLPPVCRLAQLFAPSERCRRGGRDDENPGLTVGHRPPPPLFGHGEPEVGLRREWGPARDLPWAGKSIYCNRLGRGQPPGSPLRLQRVVSALPTLIICRAHIPSITGTAAQHSLSPLSLCHAYIHIYIFMYKGGGRSFGNEDQTAVSQSRTPATSFLWLLHQKRRGAGSSSRLQKGKEKRSTINTYRHSTPTV